MKHYYKVIRTFGHSIPPTTQVWHCSPATALKLNGFIIPLDRKPRGVDYINEGV